MIYISYKSLYKERGRRTTGPPPSSPIPLSFVTPTTLSWRSDYSLAYLHLSLLQIFPRLEWNRQSKESARDFPVELRCWTWRVDQCPWRSRHLLRFSPFLCQLQWPLPTPRCPQHQFCHRTSVDILSELGEGQATRFYCVATK